VVRTEYTTGYSPAGDIIYSLRTLNDTLSLQAAPGYDDVTGRGSPTAGFFAALAQ
jgi:hypothetical protein